MIALGPGGPPLTPMIHAAGRPFGLVNRVGHIRRFGRDTHTHAPHHEFRLGRFLLKISSRSPSPVPSILRGRSYPISRAHCTLCTSQKSTSSFLPTPRCLVIIWCLFCDASSSIRMKNGVSSDSRCLETGRIHGKHMMIAWLSWSMKQHLPRHSTARYEYVKIGNTCLAHPKSSTESQNDYEICHGGVQAVRIELPQGPRPMLVS
jgi:hypothetical protein